MKFIHLSDIHLGAPGALIEGLDPYDRLARAFGHMAEHHADAARLVITGDLTHHGDPVAYGALQSALRVLPMPVRLMLGNHDDRQAFFNAFPDHSKDENGYVNHAEEVQGVRFIYCDTVRDKSHAGAFCEPRRAWLASQLALAETAYLFFHHNILDLGDPCTDELSLDKADQAELRAVLKAYRHKIGHIFFGHVHEPLCGTLAGIPFSGVASTMHQTIPVLAPSNKSPSGPLEPSYRVVLLRGEDVVIHQIPFAWDGEVTWHGNDWGDWQ
ncbi:MAG: metallophosphoesterase [Pelagimonas sp.]|uniref:metallophosphoesterase n=1 Tax=Pelagimonas sp. TaxID=2073170 RepID=UPI003D6A8F43